MNEPLSPYELDRLADELASRIVARLRSSVDSEALLTASDAAALLRVSRATLERWTASGTIPSHRIGRTRRYKRAELLDASHRREANHGGE